MILVLEVVVELWDSGRDGNYEGQTVDKRRRNNLQSVGYQLHSPIYLHQDSQENELLVKLVRRCEMTIYLTRLSLGESFNQSSF